MICVKALARRCGECRRDLGMIKGRFALRSHWIEHDELAAFRSRVTEPNALIGKPLWTHRMQYQRSGVVVHELFGMRVVSRRQRACGIRATWRECKSTADQARGEQR